MSHDNVMAAVEAAIGGCQAGGDGECYWPNCPQERDGEPSKSGRNCPLWIDLED